MCRAEKRVACQPLVTRLTVSRCQWDLAEGPSFTRFLRCQCIELNCDAGHYWPDDPLVAEATAWAKPRGT
jgi:hypothetical protein